MQTLLGTSSSAVAERRCRVGQFWPKYMRRDFIAFWKQCPSVILRPKWLNMKCVFTSVLIHFVFGYFGAPYSIDTRYFVRACY